MTATTSVTPLTFAHVPHPVTLTPLRRSCGHVERVGYPSFALAETPCGACAGYTGRQGRTTQELHTFAPCDGECGEMEAWTPDLMTVEDGRRLCLSCRTQATAEADAGEAEPCTCTHGEFDHCADGCRVCDCPGFVTVDAADTGAGIDEGGRS